MGARTTATINGVRLGLQSFGDPADPAILLIGGSNSPMDWWDTEFCERLAEGARFVIRYDHRDTGQSVSYPPGAPGYTGDDLAADAIGVLDHVGVALAHVVGISMGGALAQLIALRQPDRVASLVLISTTGGPGDPDLPGMSEQAAARFANVAPVDWSDATAAVDGLVANMRLFAATGQPFEETRIRAVATQVVERTVNLAASLTNHGVAEGSGPWRHLLPRIAAPTLVLHGTEDPLFPYAHGIALAREIPDAHLVPMPHTGHELPQRMWNVVLPAILLHTSVGWDEQAGRLARKALAAGKPTSWFERLYAGARQGAVAMPWDRGAPSELLRRWAEQRELDGTGRSAVVVGCGLGENAEFVSGLGFRTVAFDIAPSAIQTVRDRRPDSPVHYRQADLLNPPADWLAAFDLVVEIYTVQALPEPPRRQAIEMVSRLVAPGGTLLVVASADRGVEQAAERDRPEPESESGPPWPLTRGEIDAFAADGLDAVQIGLDQRGDDPEMRRWVAEFHRQDA